MTDFDQILPADAAAVADELVALVASEISPGTAVAADTDLVMSGIVDSLGVVRIVAWLEERLDTRIDPGDVVIEHFETVDAIVAYLRARGDVA